MLLFGFAKFCSTSGAIHCTVFGFRIPCLDSGCGSEAGSYLRLIDFAYHSTQGVRVTKKKDLHGAARLLPRELAGGHPEVRDPRNQPRGHENVERLDVSVHVPDPVEVLQPGRAPVRDAVRRGGVEFEALFRVQVEEGAFLADLREQQRAPVRIRLSRRQSTRQTKSQLASM